MLDVKWNLLDMQQVAVVVVAAGPGLEQPPMRLLPEGDKRIRQRPRAPAYGTE